MAERCSGVTLGIVGATGKNLLHQQIGIVREWLLTEIASIVAKPAQDVETARRRIEPDAVGQTAVPEWVICQDQSQ